MANGRCMGLSRGGKGKTKGLKDLEKIYTESNLQAGGRLHGGGHTQGHRKVHLQAGRLRETHLQAGPHGDARVTPGKVTQGGQCAGC